VRLTIERAAHLPRHACGWEGCRHPTPRRSRSLAAYLVVVDAHALSVAGVAAAQGVAGAVPGQAQAADRVIGQDTALAVCTKYSGDDEPMQEERHTLNIPAC